MLRTLDTNICSYILRRRPFGMIERFATLQRDQLGGRYSYRTVEFP